MLDRLLLPEEEIKAINEKYAQKKRDWDVEYNNGEVHGDWVAVMDSFDLDCEKEKSQAQLRHAVLEMDKAGMMHHSWMDKWGNISRSGEVKIGKCDADCPACKLIRELEA